MRKQVIFIANSLTNAYKFQQVLSELDVEIAAGSTEQIRRLPAPGTMSDLVIFEALATAKPFFEEVELLAENRGCPLLVIVDEEGAEELDLPVLPACDFVMNEASGAECLTRIRRLLGVKGAGGQSDTIVVDGMSINLATYQVTVADEPVDFTYLEYALLAYLVQHSDHTFSRDILLQSVWGFDYCGGARTVDVHVRRIRAKLGPNLAQHLETVRGVGYLWNSQ